MDTPSWLVTLVELERLVAGWLFVRLIHFAELTEIVKLRCSGNRDGCDRCRTSSADCTYALADIGTGRRRPRRMPTTPATSSSRSSRVSSRPGTATAHNRINGDQPDLLIDPYATSRSSPHTGEGDSDGGTSLQHQQQQQQQQRQHQHQTQQQHHHQQHINGGNEDHSATDTSMQDWDDLAWDDSLFGLDHQLPEANVYNYLHMGEPFANHRDPISFPFSSSIRWPGPSQQPVAESLALQLAPQQALKVSTGSDQRQGCDCLGALVKVLENIGKSQTQTEWTGIDMQLMSLWQAMHTCQQVIACNSCSTCSDSPVLVATIIQLFAGISDELGSICGRSRANNDSSEAHVKEDDMAVGAVWIGRYRLEELAMRLPLVREVVVMHLMEMRAILKKLRERLGPRHSVRQQAAEAEQKAREICDIIRAVIREDAN